MSKLISQQLLLFILCSFTISITIAQPGSSGKAEPVLLHPPLSFAHQHTFIEQAGQFQLDQSFESLGKIIAGYEGFSMPAVFTSGGIVFLQKKTTPISHQQEEALEKQGMPEEEIERRTNEINRAVSMEWVNANPDPEIVLLDKTKDYHTYGTMPGKAYGYSRIFH